MFYLFSPNGMTFSGPLEKLRQVEKSVATPATKTIIEEPLEQEIGFSSKQKFVASQKSLDQYKQILEKSNKQETVYHAYQIMSQPVAILHTDNSLMCAINRFQQNSFNCMPVLNEKQQLVAMLTKQQVVQAMKVPNVPNSTSRNYAIAQIISDAPPVLSADPVTDIRRITSILLEKRLNSIPIVTDAGNLVGILTRTDILHCLINEPPLSLWS